MAAPGLDARNSTLPGATSPTQGKILHEDRLRPILLWDVMDTLVRDPFRDVIPRFHGLSIRELLAAKNPDAWPDFEMGRIDEATYGRTAFLDGRTFDPAALKAAMVEGYAWLPGMEMLLADLKGAGWTMHALSNYPDWYQLIEGRLGLSRYLPWTFVSCRTGVRKPHPEAYLGAARTLGVAPEACLFIDDREENVAAARAVGMGGLRYESAEQVRAGLHLFESGDAQ